MGTKVFRAGSRKPAAGIRADCKTTPVPPSCDATRMNLIEHTLATLTLGEPIAHGSITMWPLFDRHRTGGTLEHTHLLYLTLDEALRLGGTEITEVSDQGSVPELRVVNRGPLPVFVLDGEELLGAKQNRVVNLSILVPAQDTITIPVSCVEAGRWRAQSRRFATAPRTQYAAGRAKRVMQVSASLRTSGRRSSDQAAVWADIAEKADRLEAHSPTGAMEEIFTRHAAFTDEAAAALTPRDGQRGSLFMVDGRVVSLDLFDSPSTLSRLLPKLVRGAAIEALDMRERTPVAVPLQRSIAEHFLARLSASSLDVRDAVGLGRDIRLEAPALAGAALALDQRIIHLAAFPA